MQRCRRFWWCNGEDGWPRRIFWLALGRIGVGIHWYDRGRAFGVVCSRYKTLAFDFGHLAIVLSWFSPVVWGCEGPDRTRNH